MNKKKILIVGRSFYPMNSPRSFRTTELVKEFARQGHDVTLLTIKNNEIHIPFEKDYNITIKDLGKMIFPPVKIDKGNKLMKIIRRGLRRALELFFRYPEIELMFKVKAAIKKEKEYDILISIAAPHPVHWGTAWAWNPKKNIAKTWIADCGDPFMLSTLDTFKKLFYFKYLEKWFCKKADYITVPLQGAAEGYYPEFRSKIRVIPQGFQFKDIELKDYFPNTTPTFAYSGGFIPGMRDPSNFLKYLVNLDLDFKFIIYSKQKDMIAPFLEAGKGRIEVRDYIPRRDLLKILSTMDFLVNISNDTSLQVPSKLIDYSLTGRPILSIAPNGFDKEILHQFLNRDYTNQMIIEDIDQYRIENVCSKFLSLEISTNSE